MATVTYDDRSFLVDGERLWLASGAIHYFRTPAALWQDRLLKARRAGLNCIDTYVAWNFHEPVEGRWRHTGDQDLVSFIRLAGQLGLYVILRPGPYICSEWDFGGLPAWLTSKTGMAVRTNNAAYTHYYDKYFRQILPRLAELQVTRGGNIVLIQNENEYVITTMPERLAYLDFITQLYRRSGFDIPITNCNLFTDPPLADSVECVNDYDTIVRSLNKMRVRQPNAPLLVSEYWDGWFDTWGQPHERRDDRTVARKALEILGCGGQFNYYMFHGGTNFSFWAGRAHSGDGRWVTTSYDFDAPLAEGGGMTRKYYLTRLVNTLATTMGKSFAAARMDQPGTRLAGTSDVLNIHGPEGSWAIVTNGGRDDIKTAGVYLLRGPVGGPMLSVNLELLGATAVPFGVTVIHGVKLDYSNLMPFGVFGLKTLVLHGQPGWDGKFSINGKPYTVKVPAGDTPMVIEQPELRIVIVNSELAMRTWYVDETLIFGPKFVGATAADVVDNPGDDNYAILPAEGPLKIEKTKAAHVRKPAAPKLSSWTRVSVCTEPVSEKLEWQKLDRPRDIDKLGVYYGYVWYRAVIDEAKPGRRHIFLPDCEDRATLFLNGHLVGVWGRGPGATRQPISVTLRKGKNTLVALADNMGRVCFSSHLGELKGLMGHIYDARPLTPKKFKLEKAEGFSRRIIPRPLMHIIPRLENMTVWEATFELPMKKVAPVHVSFADLPYAVAVLCNDRPAAVFAKEVLTCGDVTLGAELKSGVNRVKIIIWGDETPPDAGKFQFHSLVENITQGAAWSFRSWTMPVAHGPIVGKDQPAWYQAKFKHVPSGEPLFLRVADAKKGQLFLNGNNVGRVWTVGPQECYYLPECWLAPENELLLFEEQGFIPRRSELEFRPLGPFHE